MKATKTQRPPEGGPLKGDSFERSSWRSNFDRSGGSARHHVDGALRRGPVELLGAQLGPTIGRSGQRGGLGRPNGCRNRRAARKNERTDDQNDGDDVFHFSISPLFLRRKVQCFERYVSAVGDWLRHRSTHQDSFLKL